MVECLRCGLVGADELCQVCRAELAGVPLLTRDVDVLARFLRLVLDGRVAAAVDRKAA